MNGAVTGKRRVCKTEKGVDSRLQVRNESQLMIIGGADYQVVPLSPTGVNAYISISI